MDSRQIKQVEQLKPKSFDRLNAAKDAIYGAKDKKTGKKIPNSHSLDASDTLCLLPICDADEAPSPQELLDIISSLEKPYKHPWAVQLFHKNPEKLEKWYLDNPHVPREKIHVMTELRKTQEWKDIYAIYMNYFNHPDNYKRVKEERLDEDVNKYLKKHPEVTREEEEEHYIFEAVDYLYEASKWLNQRDAKSTAPRITTFLYKSKINATLGDAVQHANKILGQVEANLLLRWVQFELEPAVVPEPELNQIPTPTTLVSSDSLTMASVGVLAKCQTPEYLAKFVHTLEGLKTKEPGKELDKESAKELGKDSVKDSNKENIAPNDSNIIISSNNPNLTSPVETSVLSVSIFKACKASSAKKENTPRNTVEIDSMPKGGGVLAGGGLFKVFEHARAKKADLVRQPVMGQPRAV